VAVQLVAIPAPNKTTILTQLRILNLEEKYKKKNVRTNSIEIFYQWNTTGRPKVLCSINLQKQYDQEEDGRILSEMEQT
jgi:hypothetical protein